MTFQHLWSDDHWVDQMQTSSGPQMFNCSLCPAIYEERRWLPTLSCLDILRSLRSAANDRGPVNDTLRPDNEPPTPAATRPPRPASKAQTNHPGPQNPLQNRNPPPPPPPPPTPHTHTRGTSQALPHEPARDLMTQTSASPHNKTWKYQLHNKRVEF